MESPPDVGDMIDVLVTPFGSPWLGRVIEVCQLGEGRYEVVLNFIHPINEIRLDYDDC